MTCISTSFLFEKFFRLIWFIWLCWVLVVEHGGFSLVAVCGILLLQRKLWLICPPACGILSSVTMDQKCIPCIRRHILNHWTTQGSTRTSLFFLWLNNNAFYEYTTFIYPFICWWIFALFNLFVRRRQWHPTPVLLPGKSHGQRSLVGCSPWDRKESDTTEQLHFHFSLSCIGEGNGNPLQCSCLENPRDRGAWWAAVYGVAQSRTWLKWLSSSSSSSSNLFVIMKNATVNLHIKVSVWI